MKDLINFLGVGSYSFDGGHVTIELDGSLVELALLLVEGEVFVM